MAYHNTHRNHPNWRYALAVFAFLSFANILQAQDIGEQKFYTAPRELHDWVFFGNTETSSWEYDQRTLVQSDSLHLRVRIRQTPLEYCYSDVRGARMWQWRSIQGYSDSLRFHPQFNYEGYEYYGFTILEEIIDLSTQKFRVRFAADYNLGGLVLSLQESGYDIEKSVSEGSPEQMIVDLFTRIHPRNLNKY